MAPVPSTAPPKAPTTAPFVSLPMILPSTAPAAVLPRITRASRLVVLPATILPSEFVTVVLKLFSPSTVWIDVNANFTEARSSSARDLLARVSSAISPRTNAPWFAITLPSGATSGWTRVPSILSPTFDVFVLTGVDIRTSKDDPAGSETVRVSAAGTALVDLVVVFVTDFEGFFVVVVVVVV